MVQRLLSTICIVALLPVSAIAGGFEAELRSELEAQMRLNELLKQRIETLEAEIAGREITPPERTDTGGPVLAAEDPESERALQRTLERRGSAVLSPGVIELTPSVLWSHTGSDSNSSTDDQYGARFDARVGLKNGWMIGVGGLYLERDINGLGDNSGMGDITTTVWKSLVTEQESRPSLVASLGYTAPTGDDFGDDKVPLGGGFHKLTATISTVKTVEPIAIFADLSYTHYLDDDISGFVVDRADALGVGAGVSLAVTPDVSLTAGLNYVFEDEVEINRVKIEGSETTLGQVQLGLGVLLSQNTFLNFFSSFGITDDSPDSTLGISLPIRF